VSFAEAVTVLEDDSALTREDADAGEESRCCMKKVPAEKYRDVDFSRAKRGPVVKPEPGKTKVSIRLDNTVLKYFRDLVDKAGGGNYQTLINDALLEHVHRRSTLGAVRQVVREELSRYRVGRGLRLRSGGPGARGARPGG
jgi:uncharacterized protein (DUF4415 family)